MQHIAADLERLQEKLSKPPEDATEKDITCKKCGKVIHFTAKQWKLRCYGCGQWITRNTRGTKLTKSADCRLCDDTGVISYFAQHEETLYRYVSRCVCGAGNKYRYMPLVTDAENAPEEVIDAVNKVIFKQGA